MFCYKCGTKLPNNTNSCPTCNTSIYNDSQNPVIKVEVISPPASPSLGTKLTNFFSQNVLGTYCICILVMSILFGGSYMIHSNSEAKQNIYKQKADAEYEANRRNPSWKYYDAYWNGRLNMWDILYDIQRKEILLVTIIGCGVGFCTAYLIRSNIKNKSYNI